MASSVCHDTLLGGVGQDLKVAHSDLSQNRQQSPAVSRKAWKVPPTLR